MLRSFHSDQDGKFNVVHVILLVVAAVALYVSIQYVPPYIQASQISGLAKTLALTGSTVETNDERNKGWFDSEMREKGHTYPKSENLTYRRINMDEVEVGYEYDYPVKHFWSPNKPHVLHFTFHCHANRGHCQ